MVATIKAEKRKVFGRKVKRLRQEGILPANIYGKKIKSLAIKVDQDDFQKVFEEVGETGIVEVQVGKEKRSALIHNVQQDPVKDIPLHVDFRQIDLKEKVKASVPVELTGESPAEKQGLGTVVQYIDEVEVEALPTDLPEKFEVDLSGLEKVDAAVYIKDLLVDVKRVVIEAEPEEIIVKVEPLREEEEELPPAEEVSEEEEEPKEGEEKAPVEEGEGKEPKEGEEKEKEKEG